MVYCNKSINKLKQPTEKNYNSALISQYILINDIRYVTLGHKTSLKSQFKEMYKISSWNMIFTYYPKDFWHKRKIDNFAPYNVFLASATNIPKRLKTSFVVQGHTYIYTKYHYPFVNFENRKGYILKPIGCA